MELLFPTSFDKVKKEKPVQKGIKPLFISEKELLEKWLKKINSEFANTQSPTLGVSHIVLVRNNETKEQSREFFSNYKCPIFTIYESKVNYKM